MHLQAGQCGSQMGSYFKKMFCDKHGIGGDGEYFGDNDAQLGRIIVLYHEAWGEKYVPRAVFFDLEPCVIDTVQMSPLDEFFRPGNLVNHTRGRNGPKATREGLRTNSSEPPLKKG